MLRSRWMNTLSLVTLLSLSFVTPAKAANETALHNIEPQNTTSQNITPQNITPHDMTTYPAHIAINTYKIDPTSNASTHIDIVDKNGMSSAIILTKKDKENLAEQLSHLNKLYDYEGDYHLISGLNEVLTVEKTRDYISKVNYDKNNKPSLEIGKIVSGKKIILTITPKDSKKDPVLHLATGLTVASLTHLEAAKNAHGALTELPEITKTATEYSIDAHKGDIVVNYLRKGDNLIVIEEDIE